MDQENLFAPGWSHVVSTVNDVDALEAFRLRVGAPPRALQVGRRWPHLDLRDAPRERALASPEVRVFQRTSDMIRFIREIREANGFRPR